MRAMKYCEWQPTANTLQMLLQMVGKVKLALAPAQPDGAHGLLHPTPVGFTTGLITDGALNLEITVDLHSLMVTTLRTDGRSIRFTLRNNASVSDYYYNFVQMLDDIGCNIEISTAPQEVNYTTGFEKQTEKRDFDAAAAREYLRNCLLAYHALTRFAAPYRGKKILPALFWTTFDMSTRLFAEVEMTPPGAGSKGQPAVIEKSVKCGFSPGGPTNDEPSFFVLPTPPAEVDLSKAPLPVKEGYFNTEQRKFLLPLAAALKHNAPEAMISQFCAQTFKIIADQQVWPNLAWLNQPVPA